MMLGLKPLKPAGGRISRPSGVKAPSDACTCSAVGAGSGAASQAGSSVVVTTGTAGSATTYSADMIGPPSGAGDRGYRHRPQHLLLYHEGAARVSLCRRESG